MSTRKYSFLVCMVAILALPVSLAAQPPDEPSHGKAPVATPPSPNDPTRRVARPVTWTDPTYMLDTMTETLGLDEKQRQESKRFLTEYRARQVEIRQSFQPPTEDTDRTRQVMSEMRAAQESNDEAKIKEATEKMRQLRAESEERLAPLRQKLADAQTDLHRQLRELMRPDQVEGFERIWQERMVDRSGYRGRVRSPQALKAAVEKLKDRSPEQDAQLDSIFKEHMESERKAGEDPVAKDRLASRLYDAVMGILSPEQRQQVTVLLMGRERPADASGDAPAGKGGTDTKPPQGDQ